MGGGLQVSAGARQPAERRPLELGTKPVDPSLGPQSGAPLPLSLHHTSLPLHLRVWVQGLGLVTESSLDLFKACSLGHSKSAVEICHARPTVPMKLRFQKEDQL